MFSNYLAGSLVLLLLVSCSTPSIVATRSIQMGDLHNNQGEYSQAILQYEKYLEASQHLGVYRNTATKSSVLRKLAHSKSALGNYNEALDELKKARKLDSLNNQYLALQEDIRLIGMNYAYQGHYKKALKVLNTVLERNMSMASSAKSVKKESLLTICLSMARLQMVFGDFNEVVKYLDMAEQFGKNITDYASYADEVELVRGITNRERGNLEIAEKQIRRSIELTKIVEKLPARQLEALAQIELLKGNYEEALRKQHEAHKYTLELGIKSMIVNSLVRMGDIYSALGDKNNAEIQYNEALDFQGVNNSKREVSNLSEAEQLVSNLELYQAQGAKSGIGLAAVRLAEYKMNTNQYEGVDSLLQRANEIFSAVESNEGIARTQLAIAKLEIHKENYSSAHLSLQISENHTKQPDLLWKILRLLGKVYRSENQLDSALFALKSSISIIEETRSNLNLEELKSSYLSNKVDVYEEYIDLLLEQYGNTKDELLVEYAFVYNERARSRAFLDMLGNKKVGFVTPEDEKIIKQEQTLRIKIQQLNKQIFNTNSKALVQELSSELKDAQNEYQRLLLDIRLNHPDYSNLVSIEPPSLSSIQKKLNDNTAILEYWLGNEELTVWLIDNKGIRVVQEKVSLKDINRQMNAFRNGLKLNMSEVVDGSLQSLYTSLIKPVEKYIDVYDHLVIIPNKHTHFLPFQALKNQKSQYLIENYFISTAPSASVWFHCRENSSEELDYKFLAMALGNSSIGKFAALPGTLTEVNLLAGIYDNFESQKELELTESFFKTSASNYSYLHIATHGVLNSRQPTYSYLLMHPSDTDDGKLTVNEIFNIKLNARLVTLSACDTGLGEISAGDDLVGLSRAFIYSGTPAVIVSLWKVDDAATSILMTQFHNYLNHGYSNYKSLAFAQRDLLSGNLEGSPLYNSDPGKKLLNYYKSKKEEIRANPFYWSPFILIGD